jgi:hypothetical protein
VGCAQLLNKNHGCLAVATVILGPRGTHGKRTGGGGHNMNKSMKCGGRLTHLVFKLSDIELLPLKLQNAINEANHWIGNMRVLQGRNSKSEYIVVNIDEEYAPELIDVLKRHNAWG